jgi:hypothetical protein
MTKTINYNKKTSEELGWRPDWFGCEEINDELTEKIKEFQREMGIQADGMCGPGTFRRKFNERAEELERSDSDPNYSDHIICHGDAVPIEWDRVVLWTDNAGHKAKEGNYKKVTGKRDIDLFVTHWDVCLSSDICQRVLDKRGISVHFLIDNDGTIYQTLDTTHVAWHAGGANKRSVGVEIANAYYPKWQTWYEKKGFGKRKILEDSIVNGRKLETHLDFYPIQKEALKALAKALNAGLSIPLEAPQNLNGSQYTDTLSKPKLKAFKGFIHHYHQTSKKIDCGGLDLVKLMEECKNG